MKFKKIFKGKLFEFFLIILGISLAVIGGYLIFNQHLFFGIISILFSFIIHFILSSRKQDKIIISPTSTPLPPASDYPKGTIHVQYKNHN
jgi:hypothetical protein